MESSTSSNRMDCIAKQRLEKQVSQQFEDEARNLNLASGSGFLDEGGTACSDCHQDFPPTVGHRGEHAHP